MASVKKKTLEYPKACPIKIAIYQDNIDRFKQQGYPVVYMDESGFEAETISAYGYAPIGKPCMDRYNWQAKKRTNVIGALYKKMLFALDYFDKNINGDMFYGWCKYTLILSLKIECVIVIVMDMSEDKAKHCFAQAQDESCARVGKEMGASKVSTPRLDGE